MVEKVLMTATKPQRYGTRRLLAGDVFEARKKDSVLLAALKRATLGRKEATIPEIPDDLSKQIKKTVPEALYGSSVMEPTYEIGGETVQLGTIVANAHKDSGLSISEWNMLPTGERDEKLFAELKRLQDAAVPPPEDEDDEDEDEEELETPPAGNAVGAMTSTDGTQKPSEPTDAEKEAAATLADLEAARAEYKEVVGRAAYGGWDAIKIRENIAAFKAKK